MSHSSHKDSELSKDSESTSSSQSTVESQQTVSSTHTSGSGTVMEEEVHNHHYTSNTQAESSSNSYYTQSHHNEEQSRRVSSFKDLLGSVMPESVKRVISAGSEGWNEEKLKDTLASEIVKKALEKSSGVVDQTEGLRKAIQHVPQELIDRVLLKLDDFKEEGTDMLRYELRRFLDKIDIQKEVQKVLTQFSIEVTTHIRFVPQSDEALGVKPKIETQTKIKKTQATEDETV